jgi:hypothetical protein
MIIPLLQQRKTSFMAIRKKIMVSYWPSKYFNFPSGHRFFFFSLLVIVVLKLKKKSPLGPDGIFVANTPY